MEAKNFSTHAEFVVILVTLIGGYVMIDSKIDQQVGRIDQVNARMDQFIMMWHEEVKDFHGRLCAIEERNNK